MRLIGLREISYIKTQYVIIIIIIIIGSAALAGLWPPQMQYIQV
jgi:hypothetical protein